MKYDTMMRTKRPQVVNNNFLRSKQRNTSLGMIFNPAGHLIPISAVRLRLTILQWLTRLKVHYYTISQNKTQGFTMSSRGMGQIYIAFMPMEELQKGKRKNKTFWSLMINICYSCERSSLRCFLFCPPHFLVGATSSV